MKKFITLILGLLMVGSVYANCVLTIEDITVEPDQESVTVPIKAHFEHWVSVFQVDLELPAGLSVQDYDESYDLVIPHFNAAGYPVDYYPSVSVNKAKTRYIVFSMESDYDNGSMIGTAKWEPGDYEMFYLNIAIDDAFKGGTIRVTSVTASGKDFRPWVTICDGCWSDTSTKVTVDGIEEEPDPYADGYWLVIGNPGEEQYVALDEDYSTTVELRGEQYEDLKIPYRFVIYGKPYGAYFDGMETDFSDFWNNDLIENSTKCYTLEGGHRYLLHTEYYLAKVMFVEAYYKDADDVDEAVTDRQVKNVRYFNINGQEKQEADGITIIVTTYTDGTTSTKKVIR